MGRGIGPLQRRILDTLAEYGKTEGDYGGAWTVVALTERLESNPESIRRAVRSLQARGLVEVEHFGRMGLAVWSTDEAIRARHRDEWARRDAEREAAVRERFPGHTYHPRGGAAGGQPAESNGCLHLPLSVDL